MIFLHFILFINIMLMFSIAKPQSLAFLYAIVIASKPAQINQYRPQVSPCPADIINYTFV